MSPHIPIVFCLILFSTGIDLTAEEGILSGAKPPATQGRVYVETVPARWEPFVILKRFRDLRKQLKSEQQLKHEVAPDTQRKFTSSEYSFAIERLILKKVLASKKAAALLAEGADIGSIKSEIDESERLKEAPIAESSITLGPIPW